jgi:carbon catabolite-derepressing protein kinase
METRKAGKATSSSPTQFEESGEPQVQSSAQQEETARRLKPHSRSQLKLDEAKRPAALTAIPQKKSKPTRWQFGIRSRNQPLEAIGCIYRALQKLGAEWVIDEDYKSENGDDGHEREQVISPSYLTLLTNDRDHHDDGSFASDNGENGVPLRHASSMDNGFDGGAHYKLPADPWVLRVRWRKDGMYPPGTIPPGSTHSSQVDLRRHSITSMSSTGGSLPSQEGPGPTQPPQTQSGVVMHLDIQLYEMEPHVYLVDFKCAGYETAEGTLLEEKEVTSPFPFLDLASKLIIQLAEAD